MRNGDVTVWRIDLAASKDTVAALSALIDDEEKVRASRFRFERHRRRFIVRRAGYRQILGSLVGTDPASLKFVSGDYGKPALDRESLVRKGKLRFNASHSGEIALIAVTKSGEIGVDIERVRKDVIDTGLLKQVMSEQELSYFAALDKESAVDGFYTAWARKEAFVKALGLGLSLDVRDLSLVGPDRTTPFSFGKETLVRNWWIHDLRIGQGYRSSLVVPYHGCVVTVRSWDWSGKERC